MHMYRITFLLLYLADFSDLTQDVSLLVDSVLPNKGVRWCTVSPAEYRKCTDLQHVFSKAGTATDVPPLLSCVARSGKYQCMVAIEADEADITLLDAGEVYLAGKWHSLIPISIEEHGGRSLKEAAVVVRRSSRINTFRDLRNKQICSAGISTMAGWIIPITRLLQKSEDFWDDDRESDLFTQSTIDIKIADCNNPVKTASEFFGPSCVPNMLNIRHNQKSDNPDILCRKCASQNDTESWCTFSDLYAGNDGVLNCMAHGVGDVGFMNADVALKLPQQVAEEFEFLCPDGSKFPLSTPTVCSWGSHPANAFVTISSKTPAEKTFLSQYIFNLTHAVPKVFSDRFPLSGERRYNGSDLMWSDTASSVRSLPEKQQHFQRFLGPELSAVVEGLRVCPHKRLRFCIVSLEELQKCTELQTALSSLQLQPGLTCVLARNHWDCMHRISTNQADVMVAEASDAYLAGNTYRMIPFMAELYDLHDPFYYAVAVAKRVDLTTTLLDLRGRRTCHGAIYGAVGWTVPVSFLLTQNRVRDTYDCQDLVFQVSQIFQKACAPGALIMAHYPSVLHPEHMCDLCMGDIASYCSRTPAEPYFGAAGAFKCLAEGGGEVAFVTHRTAWENTDGRNMRVWSRALVSQDYELLCQDGTRAPIDAFAKCNLGKVPANVLMTSGSKTEAEVTSFANVFNYAQEFFGAPYGDNLRMFASHGALNQDLIFRDATTRLVLIPSENRTVENYLGDEFIRVAKRAQCSAAEVQAPVKKLYMVVSVLQLLHATFLWFL